MLARIAMLALFLATTSCQDAVPKEVRVSVLGRDDSKTLKIHAEDSWEALFDRISTIFQATQAPIQLKNEYYEIGVLLVLLSSLSVILLNMMIE